MTTPNGCQHCGIPQRAHYQQWTRAAGWHQWQPPTDEQIKTRMQQRRTARTKTTCEATMTDTTTRNTLQHALAPLVYSDMQASKMIDAYRDQILTEAAELIQRHQAAHAVAEFIKHGWIKHGLIEHETRIQSAAIETAAKILLNARTTTAHVAGQLCADPDCGPCSFDRAIPAAEMAAIKAARTTTTPEQ